MYVLELIAAAGAAQGAVILLSILLRFRPRKNMPLALLLIVFSLRLATIPTWRADVLLPHPWVYPLTAPLPFLFGPFLWWYLRELVSDTPDRPKLFFIHLVPYAAEVLAVSFTVLSMTAEGYELFIRNVFSGNPPLWLPVRNGLKVLANVLYIAVSVRIAFGRKSGRLSRTKRLWIRFLVIVPAVVLAVFSYVAVNPAATGHLSAGIAAPFTVLSVAMAVLIYGISFLLLIAPDASGFKPADRKGPGELLCGDEECEHLVELVEKRFREGGYRNPDLMLSDLAEEFGVHPNRLSFAVNRHFNAGFKALLNSRRLDYFCGRVEEGALKKQSILDLAFEAGFPSKSTFNRVFREHKGMAPSDYVRQAHSS